MALEKTGKIDVKQVSGQTTQTTQSSAAASSQSSGIIPVGASAKALTTSIALLLKNNEELMKLPLEEQLEVLKKKYPSVSESNLKAMLNLVKSSMAESSKEKASDKEISLYNEDGAPATKEPVKTTQSNKDAVKTGKSDASSSAKASKTEAQDGKSDAAKSSKKAAEQGNKSDAAKSSQKSTKTPAEDTTKSDSKAVDSAEKSTGKTAAQEMQEKAEAVAKPGQTIDDILAQLKTKKKDELTADEKALLDSIEEVKKQEVKTVAHNIDVIIAKKKQDDPKWNTYSPTQKLDICIEEMVRASVPNYDSMDEAAQKSVQNAFKDKMLQSMSQTVDAMTTKPNKTPKPWSQKTDEEKAFINQLLAVAITSAEAADVSLEKFISGSKTEKAQMFKTIGAKLIDTFNQSIDIDPKKWAKMTPKQKMEFVTKGIASSLDPTFKDLPKKEQEKILQLWKQNIDAIILPDNDSGASDILAEKMANYLEYIAVMNKEQIPFSKFLELSDEDRIKLKRNWEKETYTENQRIQGSAMNSVDEDIVLSHKCKKLSAITNADRLDYLRNKAKAGTLTEKEKDLLDELEYGLSLCGNDEKKKQEYLNSEKYNDELGSIINKQYDGNVNKFFEDQAAQKGCTVEDLISQYNQEPEKLRTALRSIRDAQLKRDFLTKLGSPQKEWKNYIDTHQLIDDRAQDTILVSKNGKRIKVEPAVIERIKNTDRMLYEKGETGVVENIARTNVQHFKNKDVLANLNNNIINMDTGKYAPVVAESYNDRRYMSFEDAQEMSKYHAESPGLSDAGKAVFSKAIVKTANNDQERIAYANTLSQVDNAAVTEGLATAANSIQTESARAQYNQAIETAIQRYSPEVQEVIRKAARTGEISESTLSRTESQTQQNQTQESSKTQEQTQAQTQTQGQQQPQAQGKTQQTQGQAQGAPSVQRPTTGGSVSGTQYTTGAVPPSAVYGAAANTPSARTASAPSSASRYSSDSTVKDSAATQSEAVESAKKSAAAEIAQAAKEEVKAEEAKKEAVLTKLEDYKKEVQKSVEKWLDNKNIELSDSEKAQIIEQIHSASTIAEIYDIVLAKFGATAGDKFIEILAEKGSSDFINEFIRSKSNNVKIIQKLYQNCKTASIKQSLLSVLPRKTVYDMISKNIIKDLKTLDPNLLYQFLLENLSSLTNLDFERYKSFLPQGLRDKITRERIQILGDVAMQDTPQSSGVAPAPGSSEWYSQLNRQSSQVSLSYDSNDDYMDITTAQSPAIMANWKQRKPFNFKA